MEKLVPKDLYDNELKVGDDIIYSTYTSTQNSKLIGGTITDIIYKPTCTWVIIDAYDKDFNRNIKKKYIYSKDRKYCNICKVNIEIVVKDFHESITTEDIERFHKSLEENYNKN